MMTYILTKSSAYAANTGEDLTPSDAARLLLTAGMWPLWEHTRCRHQIKAGDRVGVYITGGRIIATASVERIGAWDRATARAYPLVLDGTPYLVLYLAGIHWLDPQVDVRTRLAHLSFVKTGTPKWGVCFMGGVRPVNSCDWAILTEPREEEFPREGTVGAVS